MTEKKEIYKNEKALCGCGSWWCLCCCCFYCGARIADFLLLLLEFMIVDDCQRFPVIKSEWEKNSETREEKEEEEQQKVTTIRNNKTKFQHIYIDICKCACLFMLGSTDVLRDRDTDQNDSSHIKKNIQFHMFVLLLNESSLKENPNLMQMHVKYGLFLSWK